MFTADIGRTSFPPNFFRRRTIVKLFRVRETEFSFTQISINHPTRTVTKVVSLVTALRRPTKFEFFLGHRIFSSRVQVRRSLSATTRTCSSARFLDDCTVRLFDLRTKSHCLKSNCTDDVLIRSKWGITSMDINPMNSNEIVCACSDSVSIVTFCCSTFVRSSVYSSL